MERDPKVSIIMPVYNAGSYVEDTIRSVLAQTFTDFELIIIIDGATDGSAEICERLAAEDSRIQLYLQENCGICAARNRGLKTARGKYIAFCDHDDLYEPEGLELLVNAAESSHAQLVKGKYIGIIVDKGAEITNSSMNFIDGECSLTDLLSDYAFFLRTINVLWNGLYSAEIIKDNNILFDNNFKAGWEDNLFNLNYLKYVTKICGVNKTVYKHIRRTGKSASLGFNANRIGSLKEVYDSETVFLFKRRKLFNAITFMDHQNRFISALKTELWYKDCPFSWRKKRASIKEFMDNMCDFKKASALEIIAALKSKPKQTVKWLLIHYRLSTLLCLYWGMTGRAL